MIILIAPVLWDGHLIPAGTKLGLPATFEERLIKAGNAARTDPPRQEAVEYEIPEVPDSQPPVDDGEPGETDPPKPVEPELNLGRGAPQQ